MLQTNNIFLTHHNIIANNADQNTMKTILSWHPINKLLNPGWSTPVWHHLLQYTSDSTPAWLSFPF